MSVKLLRPLSVFMVLALLVASCGNDDDNSAGTADTGSSPTASATASEPAPATAVASAVPEAADPADDGTPESTPEAVVIIDESQEIASDGAVPTGNTGYIPASIVSTECTDGRPTGGTLTLGMFGDLNGWDATSVIGGPELGLIQLTALYDALFYFDATTSQIVPGLAEAITTEDNEVFTLKLREGINFSDGTPLNADAVIWNVELHQNPDIGSRGRDAASQIAQMTKIDDYTVEVTAAGKNAVLPQVFSDRLAFMMSPTAYQAGQDPETGLNPELNINPVGVGAGPFLFESWIQDDQAVLVRNPDYFRDGCPYLDRLIFKPIGDAPQRYNAFKAGDLDIAYDRVPQHLSEARDEGINSTSYIENHGANWLLNNSKPPFNVRACRLAVAHAVDYDAFNEVVFDGLGIMDRSLMRPGSPWADPSATLPGYDPDKAAEALAECESELGGPLEFENSCSTTPDHQLQAETLIAMWQAVGITSTVVCRALGETVASVFAGEAIANFWAIPIADPDGFYGGYFGDASEVGVCGPNKAGNNYGFVCHPDFDEALKQGREGLTFEERYDAYSRFQHEYAEEVPSIITFKREGGYYWTDEVSGVMLTDGNLIIPQFIAKG
ncbi:MAG: ABC transporter substrate-binding protein [bacterium]|nr:ABC transporter substrate-binding protein [bacterium]